jgi:hypothetical protein
LLVKKLAFNRRRFANQLAMKLPPGLLVAGNELVNKEEDR